MQYVGVNISFRSEEAKRDELDQIAESMDRDRSWVINEAIDNYLDLHRWQAEQIRLGIADTDAGRTHSMEEVRDHFSKKFKHARPGPAK